MTLVLPIQYSGGLPNLFGMKPMTWVPSSALLFIAVILIIVIIVQRNKEKAEQEIHDM